MSSNPQLVIVVSPDGFDQVLVEVSQTTFWSFPVIYEIAGGSDPAQTANINISGQQTPLVFGQPCQMISGSGTDINLTCQLGPKCSGVKIGANPFNIPLGSKNSHGCPSVYPQISEFSAQNVQDPSLFQIVQLGSASDWILDVDLSIQQDPEQPPTSASVSLFVDRGNFATLNEGQNSFTPNGSSLAFVIDAYQGPGSIKLAYTLVQNG